MELQDQRGRVLTAMAAAVVSLVAYLLTAGDSPYWQDSGLYLASMHQGGGLYPPGFPLWLMAGRPFVWTLGLVGVPFTYAVHAFSAVWGAVAAGVATLAMLLVATPGYRFFTPGERQAPEPLSRATLLLGGVLGVAVGLSYSLWFQSLTAEVYSLNAAFAMGVLYCLLRLGADGPLATPASLQPAQRRWIWALAIIYGLSFANHPVTIVWLAPLAVLLVWHRGFWFGAPAFLGRWVGLFLACGLLPYFYLPLYAVLDPAAQYGDVTSVGSFCRHVSGTKWTGEESSYGFDAWRFGHFPLQAWYEWLVAGALGLAVGLRRWWALGAGARWTLAAFAVVAFLVPIRYLQGSEYDFWFMPLWLVGWVLAGAGWLGLFARLHRPAWFVPAVGLLALAPAVWINAPLVNRSGDYVPEDFARQLLDRLEPNALYFAISDQECSLTLYAQRVRGMRPDVVIVQKPVMGSPWYPAWLRAVYPGLAVPAPAEGQVWSDDVWAMQLIRANPERTPYISAQPLPMQLAPGESWIPQAGLWRLHRGESTTFDPKDWELRYRNADPFARPARLHHQQKRYDAAGRWYPRRVTYEHEVRSYHQQAFVNLAQFYRGRGAEALAMDVYERIYALWPELDAPQLWADVRAFAAAQGRPWPPVPAPK